MSWSENDEREYLRLLELEIEDQARNNLLDFVLYVNPTYKPQWFHIVLCYYLDLLHAGAIRNLAVFIPPQHGKSELVSRSLPAFSFGANPDLKVIHASYAADLVQGMNRAIQRTMTTDSYGVLFPDTRLNSKQIRTVSGSWLRNNDEFEIMGRRGAYACAGVNGGITGKTSDLGIIDDPISGYADAISAAIRLRTWEWYNGEFLSRTHNDTRKVLIVTRWHELDLAGMILEAEPDEWTVIRLPALCEDPEMELRLWQQVRPDATEPPRQLGEALWPERFSTEVLQKRRALNPHLFQAVYQQDPRSREGGMFKLADLLRDQPEYPPAKDDNGGVVYVRYWDLGGSDSKKADSTVGVLMARKGRLFTVCDVERGQWSPNERNQRIRLTCQKDRAAYGRIETWIEKVPGLAVEVIDNLVAELAGFNVRTEMARQNKETRADPFASQCEAGNVRVLKAPWVTAYVDELTVFPNGKNDDQVDASSGAFSKLVNIVDTSGITAESIDASVPW